MVTVRFFARLKDIVGTSELEIPLETETTARAIFDRLAETHPAIRPFASSLLVAVNQEYRGWDEAVGPGDEVAFFPPVSGGAA